jgi:O-antigen/teichoic acid export membrane protein
MKENKKLTDLSLEELHAKKKTLKGATIGLGIVMLIACATLIYLGIKNKNYSLITVAICCSITLLPSISSISQINTEIKKRENS